MFGYQRISWLLLAACISMSCLPQAGAREAKLILFSPEEASELRLADDSPVSIYFQTRGLAARGPIIEVQSPHVRETDNGLIIQTGSPTRLAVRFKPNLAPVDMSTLEISAKKGIFSQSLTQRLRPYVRGTNLRANDVEIPTGEFSIRIAIADQNGTKTARTYRLVVSSP